MSGSLPPRDNCKYVSILRFVSAVHWTGLSHRYRFHLFSFVACAKTKKNYTSSRNLDLSPLLNVMCIFTINFIFYLTIEIAGNVFPLFAFHICMKVTHATLKVELVFSDFVQKRKSDKIEIFSSKQYLPVWQKALFIWNWRSLNSCRIAIECQQFISFQNFLIVTAYFKYCGFRV